MTCIVVEDEEFAIEYLESLITKVPYLELKETFTDSTEALLYLRENPVDLVFLDIQMPKLNGVEFIQLAGNKPKYVFTSAYPQYAVKGFELDVIDFLEKPFSYDRFLKAIQKVLQQIDQLEKGSVDFMLVKKNNQLQAVNYADICYVESYRNTIIIHTDSGSIDSVVTISDTENKLSPSLFTRIHKSYIIANSHILIVDKDAVTVRCGNQPKVIPIGVSYRKTFIQSLDPKIIKKPGK